jgi:hypothetical protein
LNLTTSEGYGAFPRPGIVVRLGFHCVAVFTISGKAAFAFASTWSLGIIPRGWGTMTIAKSGAPKLSVLFLARPINSVVEIVTVGIPSFSTASWSPTSHEVQLPQSHCDPITTSGLYVAMIFAF